MTDAQKIAALVACRLEQADEALSAAELNLSNGLERSAVDRALCDVLRRTGAAPVGTSAILNDDRPAAYRSGDIIAPAKAM